MPNEVLYFLFIAMVIATCLNLMGFIRSRKSTCGKERERWLKLKIVLIAVQNLK